MDRQKIIYLSVFLLLLVSVLLLSPGVGQAPGNNVGGKSAPGTAMGGRTERSYQATVPPAAPAALAPAAEGASVVASKPAGKKEFSRLNFFLTAPVRASLAIPADWEGSYLTEENARTIDFIFATPAGERIPLFTVKWFDQADWQEEAASAKNFKELKTAFGFVFAIETQAKISSDDQKAEKYDLMIDETPLVLDSFKAYKVR